MTQTATPMISRLKDDEIQARVGAQSFQRGRQYFRDRAIFDARQQGMTLKARCLGSSGGPYRLRITFTTGGIADAVCSCPVGAGGYCKHVANLRTLGSRGVVGYGYGLYGPESLALQVAHAAADTHPDAALEIYKKQVERLIEGRNRGSYAEAACLLVQVRDIYARRDDPAAWSNYLAELRERYRTLRALKEELAAAGL